MSKWICQKCQAINPDLSSGCHNCKDVPNEVLSRYSDGTAKNILDYTFDDYKNHIINEVKKTYPDLDLAKTPNFMAIIEAQAQQCLDINQKLQAKKVWN